MVVAEESLMQRGWNAAGLALLDEIRVLYDAYDTVSEIADKLGYETSFWSQSQ